MRRSCNKRVIQQTRLRNIRKWKYIAVGLQRNIGQDASIGVYSEIDPSKVGSVEEIKKIDQGHDRSIRK